MALRTSPAYQSCPAGNLSETCTHLMPLAMDVLIKACTTMNGDVFPNPVDCHHCAIANAKQKMNVRDAPELRASSYRIWWPNRCVRRSFLGRHAHHLCID